MQRNQALLRFLTQRKGALPRANTAPHGKAPAQYAIETA